MKKNKMMRVASALLVVVLLTTCAISGTFAKYVSEKDQTDTARVAKWGVSITTKSNTLFLKEYAGTKFEYTVQAGAGDYDYVMAPGTGNSMTEVTLGGTPEVAVAVEFTPTVTVTGNWIVAGDFYCPIIVTIGDEDICGLDFESADDFAEAIATEIGGYSAEYEPNKDLSEITNGNLFDISWAWAFDGTDYATAHTGHTHLGGNDQDDTKDTALGDVAVAEDLQLNIAFEISVTQID